MLASCVQLTAAGLAVFAALWLARLLRLAWASLRRPGGGRVPVPPCGGARYRLGGGWTIEAPVILDAPPLERYPVLHLVCPSRRRCWVWVPRQRHLAHDVPSPN